MNAIISIKPEFSKKIVQGDKTVEVRRRGVNLELGDRLWVYETLPTGKVMFVVIVDHVFKGCPAEIWGKYADQIDISVEEFEEYFDGCDYGSAIAFKKVELLSASITLSDLKSFGLKSMPQTYRRLDEKGELYSHFVRHLS